MTTIVALGDSIAFGVGDGDGTGIGPGWSGRLARAIAADAHLRLAWPGAQLCELTTIQAPATVIAAPDIVLVSFGGNDAIRRGFDADHFSEQLRSALDALQTRIASVVIATLPDISLTCQIPRALRPHLHDRIALLNSAITGAARGSAVRVLDRWIDRDSYLATHLAADRVHPSPCGYQSLAQSTAGLLGLHVIAPTRDLEADESMHQQPRWWVAAHGVPWAVKRSARLVPTAVSLVRQGRASGLSN